MKTIILRWNPSFSSYTMSDFLNTIKYGRMEGHAEINWSVWEHEKVEEGDRFYFLKLGPNGTGIVGVGTVMGKAYAGEDWTGKGRKTYYADFSFEMAINPDALPIITIPMLEARIPDVDWRMGHSGEYLGEADALKLETLWEAYLDEHERLFTDKDDNLSRNNDYIYWDI